MNDKRKWRAIRRVTQGQIQPLPTWSSVVAVLRAGPTNHVEVLEELVGLLDEQIAEAP